MISSGSHSILILISIILIMEAVVAKVAGVVTIDTAFVLNVKLLNYTSGCKPGTCSNHTIIYIIPLLNYSSSFPRMTPSCIERTSRMGCDSLGCSHYDCDNCPYNGTRCFKEQRFIEFNNSSNAEFIFKVQHIENVTHLLWEVGKPSTSISSRFNMYGNLYRIPTNHFEPIVNVSNGTYPTGISIGLETTFKCEPNFCGINCNISKQMQLFVSVTMGMSLTLLQTTESETTSTSEGEPMATQEEISTYNPMTTDQETTRRNEMMTSTSQTVTSNNTTTEEETSTSRNKMITPTSQNHVTMNNTVNTGYPKSINKTNNINTELVNGTSSSTRSSIVIVPIVVSVLCAGIIIILIIPIIHWCYTRKIKRRNEIQPRFTNDKTPTANSPVVSIIKHLPRYPSYDIKNEEKGIPNTVINTSLQKTTLNRLDQQISGDKEENLQKDLAVDCSPKRSTQMYLSQNLKHGDEEKKGSRNTSKIKLENKGKQEDKEGQYNGDSRHEFSLKIDPNVTTQETRKEEREAVKYCNDFIRSSSKEYPLNDIDRDVRDDKGTRGSLQTCDSNHQTMIQEKKFNEITQSGQVREEQMEKERLNGNNQISTQECKTELSDSIDLGLIKSETALSQMDNDETTHGGNYVNVVNNGNGKEESSADTPGIVSELNAEEEPHENRVLDSKCFKAETGKNENLRKRSQNRDSSRSDSVDSEIEFQENEYQVKKDTIHNNIRTIDINSEPSMEEHQTLDKNNENFDKVQKLTDESDKDSVDRNNKESGEFPIEENENDIIKEIELNMDEQPDKLAKICYSAVEHSDGVGKTIASNCKESKTGENTSMSKDTVNLGTEDDLGEPNKTCTLNSTANDFNNVNNELILSETKSQSNTREEILISEGRYTDEIRSECSLNEENDYENDVFEEDFSEIEQSEVLTEELATENHTSGDDYAISTTSGQGIYANEGFANKLDLEDRIDTTEYQHLINKPNNDLCLQGRNDANAGSERTSKKPADNFGSRNKSKISTGSNHNSVRKGTDVTTKLRKSSPTLKPDPQGLSSAQYRMKKNH